VRLGFVPAHGDALSRVSFYIAQPALTALFWGWQRHQIIEEFFYVGREFLCFGHTVHATLEFKVKLSKIAHRTNIRALANAVILRGYG
jgi:hypothetical protein